ncbi:hypothetical protein D3C72_1662520 [compost metagenome]
MLQVEPPVLAVEPSDTGVYWLRLFRRDNLFPTLTHPFDVIGMKHAIEAEADNLLERQSDEVGEMLVPVFELPVGRT